jgi:hypothetical protein
MLLLVSQPFAPRPGWFLEGWPRSWRSQGGIRECEGRSEPELPSTPRVFQLALLHGTQ